MGKHDNTLRGGWSSLVRVVSAAPGSGVPGLAEGEEFTQVVEPTPTATLRQIMPLRPFTDNIGPAVNIGTTGGRAALNKLAQGDSGFPDGDEPHRVGNGGPIVVEHTWML